MRQRGVRKSYFQIYSSIFLSLSLLEGGLRKTFNFKKELKVPVLDSLVIMIKGKHIYKKERKILLHSVPLKQGLSHIFGDAGEIMTEIDIPVRKIDDVKHADICGLKNIVESIEAFDNGEWRPWNHVSAVLKFLGASTVSKDYKEKGYEGLGIESEFLHPDEILVAVCSRLKKEEKLSYQDMPYEAHRWMASPRVSAFEIMENAKNGNEVKAWQEEGLPSDMGYYYPRHKMITETVFGLYKVQCLWQKDDGPWQVGGDHKYKEIGYRVLMA